MSTLPIGSASATAGVQSATVARTDEGGQFGTNAFMKLLVSELKNQDPLNPMESRDMIAQLAQLSSVEKLNSIDTALNSLNSGISDLSNHGAAGLIGKKVTADGSRIDLSSIGSSAIDFSLNGAAVDVDVVIRNSSGEVVRAFALKDQAAGAHRVQWDGKNDAGVRATAGTYSAEITAKDSSKNLVACSQQISGLVNKISYENGKAELLVNNSRISLGHVLSISQ